MLSDSSSTAQALAAAGRALHKGATSTTAKKYLTRSSGDDLQHEASTVPPDHRAQRPQNGSGTTRSTSHAVPLVYHRLPAVLQTKRLADFETPKEMLSVVQDAFEAHRALYERCGIVHGDVNNTTVAMSVEKKAADSERPGFLVDWDLATRNHPTHRFVHDALEEYEAIEEDEDENSDRIHMHARKLLNYLSKQQ